MACLGLSAGNLRAPIRLLCVHTHVAEPFAFTGATSGMLRTSMTASRWHDRRRLVEIDRPKLNPLQGNEQSARWIAPP